MNKKKKILIASLIISITILVILIFIPHGIIDTIQNIIQKEEEYSFTYEIKEYITSTDEYLILVVVTNPDGIETIEYLDSQTTIDCRGKNKVAFDYTTKDLEKYKFKITLPNEVKDEEIDFEKPRVGRKTYTKVNGLYVHKPNIDDGINKEYTRYLIPSDGSETLQPGSWVTEEAPGNWYDYKNRQWANIYVENNGVESYYVWIPRYAYKKEEGSQPGNERVDIKFIDVYNNYKDADTESEMTWDELKERGYKIPEAFEWEIDKNIKVSIPGYWISKYELSDLGEYLIDYNLTANKYEFNVNNFRISESKKDQIARYTYAINGEIKERSEELIDGYTFKDVKTDVNNVINVTALNAQGEIVGSMTKRLDLVEVNKPNLEGFDEDTTFYVYWDEAGNEHNEIPISEEPPADWYNYTFSSWANIVTRNNGLESYFVWIPRYQYRLDTTSQRTNIRFIEGIGTETETGYKIPEAFTTETDEGQRELEGYWISKYELSTEEAETRLDAELAVSNNLIRVKDIKGTLIDNANAQDIELKYEYYLDGNPVKKDGDSNLEHYVYEGLHQDTTYTVNIIVREKVSDKYVGAITKKVTTKKENAPQFDGFNLEKTYYVTYDDDGSPIIGANVEVDENNNPINAPEGWYDYSQSKWANIATINDGLTSYFVWIPRYEYRILTDRGVESIENRRVEVNFIEGTSTQTSTGYKIPEAFWWDKDEDGLQSDEEQLKGYWISKYELSN